MTIYPCFIGIDIGKDHLDLFDERDGRSFRVRNSADGVGALIEGWTRQDVFIVFEATGVYDDLLRRRLEAAGLRFSRVNPARARDFAKACGLTAKTDALDARVLAAMGRALSLRADAPGDDARARLACLHKRRDQLVDMRAAERIRRSEAADHAASLARHIAWLDDEIRQFDRLIAEAVRANQQLAEIGALLGSAPGVGPVTTTTLLALMPELGERSPKTIAALAGLAPFNHDSGRRKGQRQIRGGRRRVRRALYMAAVAAVRTNKRFKAFYDAIRARRAAAKIALIAVARKLLVVLNAMIKTKTAFQS